MRVPLLDRPLDAPGLEERAGPSETTQVESPVIAQLRAVAGRHALTGADVRQLVRDVPNLPPRTRVLAIAAAGSIFGSGGRAVGARQLRALVEVVEDTLDEDIDARQLESLWERAADAVRDGVAGFAIMGSTWIVLGGLLTGRSALFGNQSPLISLVAFSAVMAALGMLEAAHIGAVSLASADVSALAASHPRVVHLHRRINTKAKLEEYLAARQFGVVLVVFLIAACTQFPHMRTLPWTPLVIPGLLHFLMSIGAPGALLVLAVAQVAPQVVAAQKPAALMNNPAVATAFSVTLLLGKLGLARPGRWLARPLVGYERIPSAPRQRFDSVTRDVEGRAVDIERREITVTAQQASLVAQTSTVFYEELGLISYTDTTLVVPFPPRTLGVESRLERNGQPVRLLSGQATDERLSSGGIRMCVPVSPAVGSFREGDILINSLRADMDPQVGEDSVVVEHPTRLVLLRVRFESQPQQLPPARLATYRIGEGGLHDLRRIERRNIEPVLDEQGVPVVSATVFYPEPGTLLRLSWGWDR
jgi:hypothetical protein